MDNIQYIRRLFQQSRSCHFKKRSIINTSDWPQTVNLIQVGYIKRYYIKNDGRISTQSIYAPNYVYPLSVILDMLSSEPVYNGSETFFYEAMTNTTVYSINATKLLEAAQTNPLMYKELLLICTQRFKSNIHQLENSGMKDVAKRIGHQLLYCADQFGQVTHNECIIELPLTHQDIADMINVNRETVTKHMLELRNNNLLDGYRNIHIPNIQKLQQWVYN